MRFLRARGDLALLTVCQLFFRDRALDDGASAFARRDRKCAAQNCSAIIHDAQSHAIATRALLRKSRAIVRDGETNGSVSVVQVNDHFTSVAMLEAVADGFLRDAKK